ncbi:MAG: sigma-54 dependent transcriptional regulator [Gammaproteobacteria bacterium]|jgi:transcriptional regulator with GAF, ATPase, and Fis domain
MNERQDIDYLPVDLSHQTLDTGHLLNENIARIEFVKMKALEWPGVSEQEKSHLMRELDILRGSLIQLSSTGRGYAATEPEPLSAMLPGADPDNLKLEGIIGRNPRIVKVLKTIAKVAATALTILLEGETGSGKELFARIIHLNSNREKFVAVNCGAFPSDIIESELFGHVKGAFTGATGDRKGKFEEADGGTIFLDEIGDLELQAQVKLLRVLELGELQRVGSEKARQVNVKVIAATHKNLEQMVANGQFREDLYYRINMCPLWIPPLRDRRDEIEILFEYFLQEACATTHKESVILNENLRDFINNRYHFPGNIRELKNIAHYVAYIAGDAPVTLSDLPERYQRYDREAQPVGPEDVPADMRELDHVRNGAEREYLTSVLRKHHGNMKKVCREMQLSRSRVYQLLNKFNLHAADYR